ncbi:MAG: hypothetical protein H7Z17_13545 [Fuerstia sp.]|nr:hypothetical protein [Fuerstiella sp.]
MNYHNGCFSNANEDDLSSRLSIRNVNHAKGWTYLRVLVAVVLAVAAIAKFFNMTEIFAGSGLLSNR